LRESLESVCANPSVIKIKAANGRQRVEAQFTWEAKARQVVVIYDKLLGRGQTADPATSGANPSNAADASRDTQSVASPQIATS
jgi:hypothetical protein